MLDIKEASICSSNSSLVEQAFGLFAQYSGSGCKLDVMSQLSKLREQVVPSQRSFIDFSRRLKLPRREYEMLRLY